MNPNDQHDDADTGELKQPTAAATAAARSEALGDGIDTGDKGSTQNVLTQDRDIGDPSHSEEVTPGAFGPFRYYVNQKLRNSGQVTVLHAGAAWPVQELTMDGQLRLSNPAGDDFALVPLDERYIPDFLAQIL